ncbi:MAG TPA: PDZ domain-containing protein [Tepidisphaeraceae bacterium]|nr:PDZ domain-containing protein [Tepidisphaeraceae bacterium]
MLRTLTSALLLTALPALAIEPAVVEKIHKDTTPSLVAVQYTWESEVGKRELVAAGLVVSSDGLVMCSIAVTPVQMPDEQMKDFKILLPGDEQKEIDATFLGRDERTNLAFIKAKPQSAAKEKDAKDDKKSPAATTWKPVKFEDVPVAVGDTVVSVGALPKTASYQSYAVKAMVSANLRGETRHVLVTNEGLAAVGSPVFNAKGQAVGWVGYQQGQRWILNDPNPDNQLSGVYSPPRTFIPTKEFAISLSDPPTADKPLAVAWLGVAQMTGVKKEVAEWLGLENQAAVNVGDVIAGTPADKAGLKSKDVIVKLDGKPLERGDEPDEAAMILMKRMKQLKAGTEVTLTVIPESDPNKPQKDVKVTLAARPKQESQAKRFYAEDLGFTAREVVFDDTYRRKLSADQKGVVIALIKPSSAAQSGKLERNDLVTKINGTAVTDVDQFKTAYQALRKDKPREAIVLEAIRGGSDEIIRIEPPQ